MISFPLSGRSLLEALRGAGVSLAVATSADRIKMVANLQAIDVPLDWFDVLVTSEDVEQKKPAPDIYLAAADKIGFAPTDCCVVEDAVHGVQAAKAAGARCVGVAGSFTVGDLVEAGADVVRERIADVVLADLGLSPSP